MSRRSYARGADRNQVTGARRRYERDALSERQLVAAFSRAPRAGETHEQRMARLDAADAADRALAEKRQARWLAGRVDLGDEKPQKIDDAPA